MLKICPITLGTGKRLFAEGTIPAAFKVSEGQVSPTGCHQSGAGGQASDGYTSWRIVGQPASHDILTRVVWTTRLMIVFGALAAANFNKS